ncbi:hypothetical protein [Calothrix rhizosoleniae]|uniref:hypothetical protein n=1 Tax=Calothrix rhizosoleniae TaxID=888997 RepID=UPI000B49D227|nr:hypothetical protein [Calothrix rhizosoleniae]
MEKQHHKTICHDCTFSELGKITPQCLHPDEAGVNCDNVTFCDSFQPSQEIDSPCVSFSEDEVEVTRQS